MPTDYSTINPLLGDILAKVESDTTKWQEINGKLAAASGDHDKAVEAFKETSQDPKVVKLRDGIEKLLSQLDEYANANVVVETLSEEQVKALNEQSSALLTEIKQGRSTVVDVATMVKADELDQVKTFLDAIPSPSGNRGRKPGSTGSTAPRVSVNILVSGGNLDAEVPYDSFSKLALVLGVETEDLVKKFAEVAGVEYASVKEANKVQEFDFVKKSVNGNLTYHIKTTEKARASNKATESTTEAKPSE